MAVKKKAVKRKADPVADKLATIRKLCHEADDAAAQLRGDTTTLREVLAQIEAVASS